MFKHILYISFQITVIDKTDYKWQKSCEFLLKYNRKSDNQSVGHKYKYCQKV